MTSTSDPCPFAVGESVIYRSSSRVRGLEVNLRPEDRLAPGERYTVSQVVDGRYTLVRGHQQPIMAIRWAAFERANAAGS